MKLNALLLAGGESRRMGQPKALMPVEGIPQYRRSAALLQPFCAQIFISCRPEQATFFHDFPLIFDDTQFAGHGPISGLLSYFQEQEAPVLLLGCDYPLLQAATLEQLFEARNPTALATVFVMPDGWILPMPAIFEVSAKALLLRNFEAGNDSIRRIIEQADVQRVDPQAPEQLRSFDTPDDWAIFN